QQLGAPRYLASWCATAGSPRRYEPASTSVLPVHSAQVTKRHTMKKNTRSVKSQLILSRETIKSLQATDLRRLAGAEGSAWSAGCPTDPKYKCTTAGFSVCYTQCGSDTSETGW